MLLGLRPGFTGFYRVLPSFTRFYWVLPGFTGFYRVLPGFTGFSLGGDAALPAFDWHTTPCDLFGFCRLRALFAN